MKTNFKKRFFSLLLCLVMVAGLLPMSQVAYAADTYTVKIGVSIGWGSVGFEGGTLDETEKERSFSEGDTVTIVAKPNDGWIFEEWTTRSGAHQSHASTETFEMPSHNVDVLARFREKRLYTITFQNNGGTGSMSSQQVYEGDTYTYPACEFTPPPGKEFDFWAISAGGVSYVGQPAGATVDFGVLLNVTGFPTDVTLSPQWKDAVTPTYYSVKFNANGHGTAPATQYVERYGTATVPERPKVANYTFGGWYKEAACINPFNFSLPITENIELYAKWTKFSIDVSVTEPLAGENPSFTASTASTICDITNDEVGWVDKGSGSTLKATDTFEAGHTYTAVIWLTPINVYINSETEVYINGKKATYSRSSGSSCQFYCDFAVDGTSTFAFTTQPASGSAKKSEGYPFSWALNDTPDTIWLQGLYGGSWINLKDLDGKTSPQTITNTEYTRFKIIAQKGSENIESNEFTVTWTEDSSPFAFTTQPASGTAKKSEGYPFSWALNDTPDVIQLQALYGGSWLNLMNLKDKTSPQTITNTTYTRFKIIAQKGSENIESNEFTVTWTEDSSPFAFTTQPASGSAKKSEGYTFSWALNDTPDVIQLQAFYFGFWINFGSLAGKSSDTITNYDYSKFRILAQKGTEEIYSNEFTVTWTDDSSTFAFTTQPASGSAKETEKYTYSWVLNDTPDTVVLQAWKPIENVWADYIGLSGASGSGTIELWSGILDGNKSTYRIVATKGSDTIYSNEFTVTWLDDSVTTYTVTFNANGHGTAPAAQTVESGKTATKPADPSETGWTFGGWYQDKTCNVAFDFSTPITGAITLYAKWTKNGGETPTCYTVTFDANGHGTAPAAQSVESGKTATKPADPSEAGWTFGGWYQDKTCNVAFDFSTPITGAITLYAKWTEESVTPITYTVTGGGDSTWTKGSNATLTITVKRSEDDANCINYFDSVEIDGTALAASDYEAKSGSTVITIKAAALQKLSTGKHTVTVKFDDGKVSTDITVKAASGSTDKPTSPKTGDESNLRLWVILMLMSILGFIATVTVGRKKRQHSR